MAGFRGDDFNGDSRHPAVHSGVVGFFYNGCLIAALFSFLIAQLAKVFTHYYTERVWDWTRVVGSGGMPSSHTAFVVGLTTAVGLHEGTSSPLFAMCLVIALIVMYDATGVRLHAGRQATVLNIIIAEMPPDHPVQDTGRLRDSLGHTPVQVLVGAVLGVVVGYTVESLYQLGDGGGGGGSGAVAEAVRRLLAGLGQGQGQGQGHVGGPGHRLVRL